LKRNFPQQTSKKFLVTRDVVEEPEAQLNLLLDDPDDPERLERFERGKERELAGIKRYLIERAEDFSKTSGLDIYDRRMDLIADLYLINITDIDTAIDVFQRHVRSGQA